MTARHAIITGLGAIAPNGLGLPAYVGGLRAGTSGVRAFNHDRCASRAAAPCATFDPLTVMDTADIKRLPRLVPMALAAAQEALAQSALAITNDTSLRIGLILGTGAGGIDFTLDQAITTYTPTPPGEPHKHPSLWTITNATHGNLAGELSIRLGLKGPSLCMSDGCASSSDALGMALELVRANRVDAMVVIGADAHVRWETLLGMELLGVMTKSADPATASRPFDAHRDGFVLGEGAWALVLERANAAASRGAHQLGALLGYAATCDAYHRVRPAPDATESARAMTLAIDDAALTPTDIELIHYHGTSTQLNDALETKAVKLAFGEHAHALKGTSVKSMIGHPQGACGAAAVVATLGALKNADAHAAGPFIPPTINLQTPDPACDLDYTPIAAAPTSARTALINCLAFGAKNSALVLQAT
ncbi:MAG: beta-ketoacyl-[acyl-carrier-protein] synthase family protein [Phycisphaerales bacterium]|nr:beta-ketoacyl-[acyl-carrier-protein] synthase family protein [Phycisphaerales bacterium]